MVTISKRYLLLAILVCLLGCSKQEAVPKGKYGLAYQAGQFQRVVKGPGVIEKTPVIGFVAFIDIENELLFGNGTQRVVYEVTDPVLYFQTFGAGQDKKMFQQLVNAEISKRAVLSQGPITRQTIVEIMSSITPSITVHK